MALLFEVRNRRPVVSVHRGRDNGVVRWHSLALIGCAVLAGCGTTTPETTIVLPRDPWETAPIEVTQPPATPPPATPPPATPPPATPPTDDPDETLTSLCAPTDPPLVDAHDVEIIGDLDAEQATLVDWVLDRFHQADLRLPATIQIEFDPSTERCGGQTGICHPDGNPPHVVVCQPTGDYELQRMNQRITLLHEVGHLWHRAQGDGTAWPDMAAIVGGVPTSPDAPWSDRMVERVAVVISWGLMNQYRRPVPTDQPCAELYRQFVELTGHRPLGPLEAVCLPDTPASSVAGPSPPAAT